MLFHKIWIVVLLIMTLHKSATEIINALGGTSAVARLTKSSSKAVSNWKAANRLPANTYLVIKDALTRTGHQAPDHLWGMRSHAQSRGG